MIIITFCFALFAGKGLVSYFGETPCSIRSELSIPDEAYFLQRPQIIEQIQNKLKAGKGIQTAVLVGMGGMGKTTLARQYGRAQNSGLVWEINAESQKKLLNSFEYLALALAKTPEEKQDVDRIRKTENEQSFAIQLLQFVKQKVAKQKGWLLIFDNVDNFEEIQKFFPNDVKAWGKGRVLITTRDDQIKNNAFIKPQNIIQIQALNAQEQLGLFTKLMINDRNKSWTIEEKKKAETFLKQIPPFPLDVAVTAQYMKNIGIGYDDYLKRLVSIDRDFESSQKTLIQKMTNYDRTRYGIISTALQQLIQKNPEFTELLLFVSVLNSQDIPKELLIRHKAPAIVEDFIAQMSKNSLLSYNPKQGGKGGSLSLHRSTQQNIGLYLQNTLKPETQTKYYEKISKTIYDYYKIFIDKHDFINMRDFAVHLLNLLEEIKSTQSHLSAGRLEFLAGATYFWHTSSLCKKLLASSLSNLSLYYGKKINLEILVVTAYLGSAHLFFGNLDQGKVLLEKSLNLYNKLEVQDKLFLAMVLRFLSGVQIALEDYTCAERMIYEAIDIYEKNHRNKQDLALSFSMLGRHHNAIGNYEQAIYWRLKSLKILQEKVDGNDLMRLPLSMFFGEDLIKAGQYVEALKILMETEKLMKDKEVGASYFGYNLHGSICTLWLGEAYRRLGCYKSAEIFLTKGITGVNQHFRSTEWTNSFLGQLYLNLGFYRQAKAIFLKIIKNPQKLLNFYNLAPQDVIVARILRSLGLIYLHEKNYPKSKEHFEKSLALYAKQYGKEHTEYAMTLADYSQFYIHTKDYKVAEKMISQALIILQKHKHPEQYKCHEYRGDMYTAQGQTKKAQAAHITALTIAKQHFPKNSAHITRLKSKIPFTQRCLLFLRFFLKAKDDK